MKKLIIFDTTLRDGEQAPGASLTLKEKIEIARQLVRLGVNVIEAGFPVSSKGDFESVRTIAKEVRGTTICGLARALKKDMDTALGAIEPAKMKLLHVFLATSKIHMKYKLRKAKEEILRIAVESVRYARKRIEDIEFSPEDASRTDPEFLFQVIEAVIDAGASIVNIPDTVGFSDPVEFGQLIRKIKENVPNIDKAIISVHCHNDLGLAVANSLSAIKNGARQVECTVNGIGERAGNASMEEIVMAIKTRPEIFSNLKTDINTKEIYKSSRLVSKLTGFVVAPNKAIVGLNAFRHESGIHQDGVIKKPITYEIIKPEDVGYTGIGLVLGKHSGRHALKERLQLFGLHLNDSELDKVFKEFKDLADKKKEVFDEDLIALVEEEIGKASHFWKLEDLEVNSGLHITPAVKITLKLKGKIKKSISSGDGPIDACYKAIDKITGIKGELLDYSIQSVTAGKDALGEVSVRIKARNRESLGKGRSTDIIEASVKAYLNAISKIANR
ncbi:MAG: 2-isopropylmalate synthase [Candidatus Omnitrophica bacterium]|nr:2-isopropylmalate synthase [Candidatus Omnitrophota bacterium]